MKFAVLGTGYWADEVHAAALAAHERAELVGVWGRDSSKADRVAGRWGARGYADPDALLSEVDAVAIALPPDVQAPLAVRAARAGKHLLLEKPIALELAAADRIVDAVADTGVCSVVFFTLRFRPPVATWLTDAVLTGGWDGANGRWLAGGTFDEGSPWAPSVWRRDRGALWDLTPHLLSVVVPALGRVESVTVDRGPKDLVHLLLTHESGASSALSVAQTLSPRVAATDVELFGAAGRSSMPDDTATDPITAFGHAVDALISSVDDGVRSAMDVRLGRHVVAVIEAAVSSLHGAPGRRVAVH